MPNIKTLLAVVLLSALLSACASLQGPPVQIAAGQVTTVVPRVVSEMRPNLAGAAVGGVAGGVVGHQFGKGNGKTALTVLGAVAGATAGSQVGMHEEFRQAFDVSVRTDEGGLMTVTVAEQGWQPGQRVRILRRGREAFIASP